MHVRPRCNAVRGRVRGEAFVVVLVIDDVVHVGQGFPHVDEDRVTRLLGWITFWMSKARLVRIGI